MSTQAANANSPDGESKAIELAQRSTVRVENVNPAVVPQTEQPLSIKSAADFLAYGAKSVVEDTVYLAKDIQTECFNPAGANIAVNFVKANFWNFVHIPYFPAFHRPGWMLRYITGPHTVELMSNLFVDFWAGVTVALTLIPQVSFPSKLAQPPWHLFITPLQFRRVSLIPSLLVCPRSTACTRPFFPRPSIRFSDRRCNFASVRWLWYLSCRVN